MISKAHFHHQKKYFTMCFLTIFTFIFIFCYVSYAFRGVSIKKEATFLQYSTDLELFTSGRLKVNKEYENINKTCKICTFKVRNTSPNSTPKDVVIASGVGVAKSLIVFIKSLRTTGCKAKCVFLLDSDAYMNVSQHTHSIVNSCGGQIINCGNTPNREGINILMYCFTLYDLFIRYNVNEFDRIMLCDLFDTVFQGDPFNSQFPKNELYLINEGLNFYSWPGSVNLEWMGSHQKVVNDYTQKYVCTGFIAGNANILTKSVRLASKEISNATDFVNDQPIFNYLLFSGEFKRNGINLVGERKNELVRHLAGINARNSELGYVEAINDESLYAVLIHHYYSPSNDGPVESTIIKYCPKEYPDLENYLKDEEYDI